MKRLVPIIICLLSGIYSRGNIWPGGGALSSGMSGIRANRLDPFAVTDHPGIVPVSGKYGLAMAFGSRYFTPGLNHADATAFISGVKGFTTGIGLSMTGNHHYNETLIKTVCSKPVHQKLNIGVSIGYYRIQLPAWERLVYQRLVCNSGFYFKYSDRLDLAMLWTNMTRTRLDRDSRERLPSATLATLILKPSEDIRFFAAWHQELQGGGSLRLAAEYRKGKSLIIRTGFSAKPFQPSLGMEVNRNGINLRVGLVIHPILGTSSGTAFYWGK